MHGVFGKVMKRVLVSALMIALLGAGAARAETPVPGALKKLQGEGGAVDFMGHAYGVDGWRITDKAGKPVYAYTTPQGGLIVGTLFRPDGTSETNEQLKALRDVMKGGQNALPGAAASKTASLKAERLYAAIESSGWTRAGDPAAPYLYIFINTNCDHCQRLWKDLEGPLRSGQLQVRLLPFGGVEENRFSGAALLSVDDPLAAWNAYIAGDKTALSKDKIKPGMLERLDANTALFRAWKMPGPPFTVYRKPADGEVTVIAGRPENTMLVLADLMKKKGAQ